MVELDENASPEFACVVTGGTTQVTRPNSYHLCVGSQSLFRSDRKPYRATTHVPRNANTATATADGADVLSPPGVVLTMVEP